MTEREIIDIANDNNGYIYKDIVSKYNIDTSYISRMAKKGLLTKVASGVYITSSGVEDELFINSIKHSKIIYSGGTALYLNNLSNRHTPKLEAVVPYGTSLPKINGYTIKQTRSKLVDLGVEEIETPFSNKVKCYNMERCICDLFIRPDHYDYEEMAYAINEYKNNHINLEKLYYYAQKLGVERDVKTMFEVIIWN